MKTVKKTALLLVAAAVLIGCIFAAGCVGETEKKPVLSISIEKEGDLVYNIGDTFTVTLPCIPSTGFAWYPTPVTNMTITEAAGPKQTSSAFGAVSSQTFTFSATEEGIYPIELTYKRAGDDAGTYYYGDLMLVSKNSTHATGKFTYEGTFVPNAGELVEISISGNPASTGYEWIPAASEGLTIVKENFIPTASPAAGTPGKYVWTVTANTPGAYVFTASLTRGTTNETPATYFFVPVHFGMTTTK